MGTLTDNITGAIAELRQGRVEFKMDRTGIVHAPIGKAYFHPQALYQNLGALTGMQSRRLNVHQHQQHAAMQSAGRVTCCHAHAMLTQFFVLCEACPVYTGAHAAKNEAFVVNHA